MPYPSEESRRDAEAALRTRAELGPEYDEHIAAGLAERVEQLAALRTAELRQQSEEIVYRREVDKSSRTQRFVLGIISLGAGIPITAISATQIEPGILGVAVSWAGIVAVNVAARVGDRRSSR